MLGLVKVEVNCPGIATVTYLTYAHASLDRILVAELHVVREGSADDDVHVSVLDLSGEEEQDDFEWEGPSEVDENVL